MDPEELFATAASKARRLTLPPGPIDTSVERLRAEVVAFFDRLPEPPIYHRVDDPLRRISAELADAGTELLARALRLQADPDLLPSVKPLADALRAHLETLCHTAAGRVDAAEDAWRRALELQREASAARRLWQRSDERPPAVYDRATDTSRYDPRPDPTVTVKLACPNPGCQKIDAFAFSPRHATHRFQCQTCKRPFVAYFGEAQELTVTKTGAYVRHYVFRIEELGGQCTKIDFDEASGAELTVARRDLLAFLYSADRELKAVLNLSSSRLLWVQRGGPCFIATVAFGEGAPELATFRAFRDEVLLRSRAGAAFVAGYYRYGPSWAAALSGRPRAKRFVRWCLARLERQLQSGAVKETDPK